MQTTYDRILAPYATTGECSLGRMKVEPACPTRTPFQRDRDRIVHCTAFRRLPHKTQVFVAQDADHFRTRLTHSLEVAQIARTMARQLGLDEDLAEAISLAHDLGHTPFGHAGERALNELMASYGGFDHNAQSLRVVTKLEHKYACFDGLNLCWETLEGLAKHNGPLFNRAVPADDLPWAIFEINELFDLKLDQHPGPEAQIAALADDIAYCNHDLDDALRAGLIEINMLQQVPLTRTLLSDVQGAFGDLASSRLIYEINRRLITSMITDAVAETMHRINQLAPKSVDDIRRAAVPVVRFTETMHHEVTALRRFLFETVYRHEQVMRIMGDAEQVVCDLFLRYMADSECLLKNWRIPEAHADKTQSARHIADFVAGMTDRYAIQQHHCLFDVTPQLR